MAKILTTRELAQIVLANSDNLIDLAQHEEFTKDLAALVTKHFGGSVGLIQYVEELNDVTVAISNDGNIPNGGGVYKDFDTEGEL
jgi:hypothetical protein